MSNTLFFKPKHKWLANIISIETPAKAKTSVKELSKLWNHNKSRRFRVLLIRSVVLSMNRVRALLNKSGLSSKERREFRIIWRVYANWLRTHKIR